MRRSLNVVGLFSGIGGFELGFALAGHHTSMLCEVDEAARAVLDDRFSSVFRATDIRNVTALPRTVDIVIAGFPCQDLSQAGTTKGLRGRDSGLHKELFRLVERARPRFVLIENVPFMLRLRRGAAMRTLLDRLEALDYRWAYRLIDTRAFGIPQRRERVFLLASNVEDPGPYLLRGNCPAIEYEYAANSICGFYWTEGNRGLGWAVDCLPTLKGGSRLGIPSPPAAWMPDGRIVVPSIGAAERLQGFPANWTRAAPERWRWRLVGNAVTVSVARWIAEQLATVRHGVASHAEALNLGSPLPIAAFGGRQGRFSVKVSTWPVSSCYSIGEFVADEEWRPLSHRATQGFAERLTRSQLRYPAEFLTALRRHQRTMAYCVADRRSPTLARDEDRRSGIGAAGIGAE